MANATSMQNTIHTYTAESWPNRCAANAVCAKHMKPAQTTVTMLCQPLVRTGTSMGVGEFVVSLIPTIIGPVPERRHCSSVRFARPKVQTGLTFRPIPVQRGIPYPRKCLNRFEKKERS